MRPEVVRFLHFSFSSAEARSKAGIKQEDIQPGGMKVWSDPFDRPGKPGHKE